MEVDPQILTRELNASDGSFIGMVRFGLRWDNEKFVCLCWAMHAAAKQRRGDSVLPRDLSQLFWYCGTFIPMWVDLGRGPLWQ